MATRTFNMIQRKRFRMVKLLKIMSASIIRAFKTIICLEMRQTFVLVADGNQRYRNASQDAAQPKFKVLQFRLIASQS